MGKDGKAPKKMISTSEQYAKNPFLFEIHNKWRLIGGWKIPLEILFRGAHHFRVSVLTFG